MQTLTHDYLLKKHCKFTFYISSFVSRNSKEYFQEKRDSSSWQIGHWTFFVLLTGNVLISHDHNVNYVSLLIFSHFHKFPFHSIYQSFPTTNQFLSILFLHFLLSFSTTMLKSSKDKITTRSYFPKQQNKKKKHELPSSKNKKITQVSCRLLRGR